jgi:hypothetical protein
MAVEYGAFVQLLHAAQADSDAARSQEVMAYISHISPLAGSIGADGHCPGDALAAPYLARMYPEPPAGDG